MKPTFGYADPAAHWRRRLHDGLAHNLGLVIAKAVQGELAAGVPPADAVRQIVLVGAHHGDGWGVGLTILTALGNLLPVLPEEETYLALFHGAAGWRQTARDKLSDGSGRRSQAVRNSRPSSAGCDAGRLCAIGGGRAHAAHRHRRRRLASRAR